MSDEEKKWVSEEIAKANLIVRDSIVAGHKLEMSVLQNEIAALKTRLNEAQIP